MCVGVYVYVLHILSLLLFWFFRILPSIKKKKFSVKYSVGFVVVVVYSSQSNDDSQILKGNNVHRMKFPLAIFICWYYLVFYFHQENNFL